MHIDYYKVLNIEPDATNKQIREAYLKLAFLYHPDRNQMNPEANTKMALINEAYDTLSDSEKRRYYDIPAGYRNDVSKFKKGDKVKVNSHSKSPYRDKVGIVENEPVNDTFRFWYNVRFDSRDFSTYSRFAEEELSEIK